MTIALVPTRRRFVFALPKAWVEGAGDAGAPIGLAAHDIGGVPGAPRSPRPHRGPHDNGKRQLYFSNLLTTLWKPYEGGSSATAPPSFSPRHRPFRPQVSRPLQQLGATTYCVPNVAIGPLILIFISPDAAKVSIAALSVFFVSLIKWMTGPRSS